MGRVIRRITGAELEPARTERSKGWQSPTPAGKGEGTAYLKVARREEMELGLLETKGICGLHGTDMRLMVLKAPLI